MINVGSVIDYMNTITDITDKVGTRIYYGLPNTTPNSDYIVVNVITNNTQTAVQETARLEFRIISGSDKGKFSTLQDISQVVYDNLQTYRDQNVFKVINSNNFQGYEANNRKVYIRDLIFYQII